MCCFPGGYLYPVTMATARDDNMIDGGSLHKSTLSHFSFHTWLNAATRQNGRLMYLAYIYEEEIEN